MIRRAILVPERAKPQGLSGVMAPSGRGVRTAPDPTRTCFPAPTGATSALHTQGRSVPHRLSLALGARDGQPLPRGEQTLPTMAVIFAFWLPSRPSVTRLHGVPTLMVRPAHRLLCLESPDSGSLFQRD